MLAEEADEDNYCGVFVHPAEDEKVQHEHLMRQDKKTIYFHFQGNTIPGGGGGSEYSVAIAVRVHKTLETVRDKFYMITCGKAGFQERIENNKRKWLYCPASKA